MKRLGEEESPPRDAWGAAWELGDKDPCSGHTHLECSSPPLSRAGRGRSWPSLSNCHVLCPSGLPETLR